MQRLFSFCGASHFCICILFVCCLSLPAQDNAKPTAANEQIAVVRAGAVSIVIPSPANDLVEPGPDYRVLFEPFAPVSNRLIAAFVMAGKIEAIHAGSAPQMDKYALVEVPRRAEYANIDPATFKQITDAFGQQFGGDLSAPLKGGQDDINQKLKTLGSSATVTIDKPIQLGAFFSKTDAVGFGMITPYDLNGAVSNMAMSLAALRVRNRVLLAYIFVMYKDEGTVKWLKATSEQWADAVLKANQ